MVKKKFNKQNHVGDHPSLEKKIGGGRMLVHQLNQSSTVDQCDFYASLCFCMLVFPAWFVGETVGSAVGNSLP